MSLPMFFPPFTIHPQLEGASLSPSFSFPTSFLWESQTHASEPSLLEENFSAHLLYEHLAEPYSSQTFEDGLFYSGDIL